MMGDAGAIYIVHAKRWIRIPREEIRMVEFDAHIGGQSLRINTLTAVYDVECSVYDPNGPDREGNPPNHARYEALLATQRQMFQDLTFHEVDADVTWEWDYKTRFWTRSDGRPKPPAEYVTLPT